MALIAGRLKHSLHLEDRKESKIMVIFVKSFLEDFITITWIVHAVQRRAKKKKKSQKILQGSITESHTHTHHTQVEDVFARVCLRCETDGE